MLPQALAERVTRGWTAALEQLPPPLFALMTTPAAEMAPFWEKLPRTIVHGDVRIANFALLPDGGVSAFRLGARRRRTSLDRHQVVSGREREPADSLKARYALRYHRLLNAQLAAPLAAGALGHAGPKCHHLRRPHAALVKALAVEAERPGALAEWNWWVEQLEAASA